jgi:hypothetical protein
MAAGNTKFKAEHGLLVVGNTEIEQSLLVSGSANVVGDLTVGGSVVFSANVTGNFIPDVSGRALGNTSNRWNMFANSLNASNTATFNGSVLPTANGVLLGDTSTRWFAYATSIDVSNNATVANTLTVSNTASVTTRVNIGSVLTIQSNTVAYTNATPGQTVVDSYASATYRSSKYLIETKNATTGYQLTELLLTHDGTTVFLTEYGAANTVTLFCTFDADISAGNVRLLATPTSNATFKIARTTIL